ncbi:MAG: nitroreductase [Clostridia bacterium]|nr:nitroreductase [Clostridia bacterium]
MTMQEAIRARHSIRRYKDQPIDRDTAGRLQALIDALNEESGLHLQLILDDPQCFDTFLGHYGHFEHADNYVAVIGKRTLPDLDERCGYYGQLLVLEAQRMGLNTCWVGGTYGHGKCRADKAAGEKIVCVISIGYGAYEGKPHPSKPLQKLCAVPEADMPDWFKAGVEAALLAPTALNQQKFSISLVNGEAVIKAGFGVMTKLDLGIVKRNFELASGHKCR